MTMTAAGVAKAIEEAGELQIELGQLTQVLGKMLAWWNTDEPHWDGSNLRERLADEIGDVQAAMQFVTERLSLDRQRIGARTELKLTTFDTWQAEIDNNDHGIDAPPKRCVGSGKLAGDLRADATTKCGWCAGVFDNDRLQDAWWTPSHDVVMAEPTNVWMPEPTNWGMTPELRDALQAWRRSLNTVGIPGENQAEDEHRLKVAVDAWRNSGRVSG